MTDKTLTIKIHTDLGDAVAAQTILQKAIQETGAALQQVSTTAKNFLNGTAWEIEYDHIVKVTVAINALKSAEAAVKGVSGLNTATIRGGSTGADLAAQFKQESAIATSALKERLNTEQAFRQNSGNTILIAQRTAAADEKAIHTKLAADILAIERDLAKGVITTANAATQQRIALERTAAKDITAIRKSVEVQQVKVTARNDSAAVYRKETQEIQSELQRRMQLEQSIRINGANSVQTLAIRTAQEETRIMQNANRQILAIEQQLQSGIIQNRGAANAMRASILSRTEAQINSNRVVLEAAQLEHRNAEAANASANAHRNMIVRAAEFIGIYQVLNGILSQVTTAMRAIPKVGIEMESTLASLSATINGMDSKGNSFGASGGTGSVFKALTEEARRTGIEISTIRENFRTFQASASLAGESLKDVWKMFTDINTVSTALHLSTDKVQLTFLAISQIFNKTKVQSEELVKQLGNLLPGAFASFVQANKQAGESTQEASLRIIKAMKAGTVAAHETIKNFTSFYSERFAGAFALARSGLNANLGDMQTSFQLLGEVIYNLNSGPILAVVKGLSSMANGLTSLITASGELKSNLQGGVNIALGLFSGYIVGLIANSALVTQAIVGLKAVFVSLNLYIDTTIVNLATLGPGMTSAAIATDMASVAMRGFTAVLAFLASPILVIAGLVAIGKGIWDLQRAAEDTAKSIKEMNDTFDKMDAIKAAKRADDKQLEVNLLVEQDRLVVRAKENLLAVTERLQKLETSNRSFGISLTKEELELQDRKIAAVTAYGRAVLAATDSIKSQKLAEEENAKNFENLQLVNTTGETEAKRNKNLEELISIQDRYNKNSLEITNAQLEAQIKESTRLTETKVNGFKLEMSRAEESFKLQQITAQQLFDIKIDYTHRIRDAELQALTQKTELESKKLQESITNHKSAYDALRMMESSGGNPQSVNVSYKKDGSWNGTALGAGQTMLSTLQKPGYGMDPFDPAIKDKIQEFKTDVTKLKEWVSKNEVGLDTFAETYFNKLVVHLGSVEKAVQQYGDNTPSYMAKFKAIYENLNGDTERQIRQNVKVADSEQAKFDILLKSKEAEVAVREELAKSNAAADKVQLDSLDKMLAKSASAEEVYQATIQKLISLESQVNSKGEKFVTPEQSKEIQSKAKETFNIAKDKELQNPVERAIPALKRYNDAVKAINKSTTTLGDLNNSVYNASLKGANQLVGVSEKIYKQQKELNTTKFEEQKKYNEVLQALELAKFDSIAEKDAAVADAKQKHLETSSGLEQQQTNLVLDGINQIAGASAAMFANNEAAQIAMQAVQLVTLGIQAVLAIVTQGSGDPYSAFARIAAMAAIVGGLVSSVGGGTVTAPVSQDSPTTGTVLGSSESSKSIGNIVDTLNSIHASEYVELRGINAGISKLNGGIINAVTKTFQTGVITGANAPTLGQSKYTTIAGGLSTDAISVADILDGVRSIQGAMYITDAKLTSTSKKGPSTYQYTDYFTAMDVRVKKSLNDVYLSIAQTMGSVSDTLGKDIGVDLSASIRAYMIPALKIDLMGLSGEDATKKVNAVISTALDTMSYKVFGGILGQYQQLGEGMLETTIRIVAEIALVKNALSATSTTMAKDVLYVSDVLIQAAGGLSKFQTQFEAFYAKFFTDAEKQTRLTKTLGSQLSDVFSPETIRILAASREGYRQVMGAIDLNTAAGQAQYSMLLSLSDSADQWYTTVYDTQNKLLDTAKSNLETAYKNEADILQQNIDKLGTFSQALKDFRDSLVLGDTSVLTPGQKYLEASKQYSETKAIIAGGVGSTNESKKAFEDAMNSVTGKAQEFLNNSRIYNASSQQYTNDFNNVLQDIASGISLADAMKTDQEKQLDALNASVSVLITINETLLSVKDAILALNSGATPGGFTTSSAIHTAMTDATTAMGRQLTTDEANWIINQFNSGRSKEEIYAEASKYIAVNGSHADGLRSVPFDGYIAQLHKGEQVLTAREASQGGTSQEIILELKALREEVSRLRSDQNEQTGILISSNYDANERAASTVVQGAKEASKETAWSAKSKVEIK